MFLSAWLSTLGAAAPNVTIDLVVPMTDSAVQGPAECLAPFSWNAGACWTGGRWHGVAVAVLAAGGEASNAQEAFLSAFRAARKAGLPRGGNVSILCMPLLTEPIVAFSSRA